MALLITHDETATLDAAGAIAALTAAADSGTLGESASVVAVGGGVIYVSITSSDTVTLADSAVAFSTFTGRPKADVVIASRLEAHALIARRAVSDSDTALDPVPVGAVS